MTRSRKAPKKKRVMPTGYVPPHGKRIGEGNGTYRLFKTLPNGSLPVPFRQYDGKTPVKVWNNRVSAGNHDGKLSDSIVDLRKRGYFVKWIDFDLEPDVMPQQFLSRDQVDAGILVLDTVAPKKVGLIAKLIRSLFRKG